MDDSPIKLRNEAAVRQRLSHVTAPRGLTSGQQRRAEAGQWERGPATPAPVAGQVEKMFPVLAPFHVGAPGWEVDYKSRRGPMARLRLSGEDDRRPLIGGAGIFQLHRPPRGEVFECSLAAGEYPWPPVCSRVTSPPAPEREREEGERWRPSDYETNLKCASTPSPAAPEAGLIALSPQVLTAVAIDDEGVRP
ncbi:hypothetical protein AXG93_3228s1020 [Marchantia polymorpha subsp. ruderalis]|uniref:Uncharacterized protein n=1 Tax=Marchantia polymorpha subsp. ruderalis TaxID=1480154 RepID=A0A176WJQ8_MARPO|nr:hypothetical protein AXG93_3228s1020 [Marchantia polymorpha subsp. ruderalis]